VGITTSRIREGPVLLYYIGLRPNSFKTRVFAKGETTRIVSWARLSQRSGGELKLRQEKSEKRGPLKKYQEMSQVQARKSLTRPGVADHPLGPSKSEKVARGLPYDWEFLKKTASLREQLGQGGKSGTKKPVQAGKKRKSASRFQKEGGTLDGGRPEKSPCAVSKEKF